MVFRKLNSQEISTLELRGCSAESWDSILVADPFDPERVRNVRFSGTVRIGSQEKSLTLPGGLPVPCGLYDSGVHNCTLGNNSLISGVRQLANYVIEEDVLVENVETLSVDGETSFGNGTQINILNEAGGRTLKIFDRLSAQIAYLIVLYRHNTGLIKALDRLIDRYIQRKRSDRGSLGKGCRLSNCTTLRNLTVGPYARLEGALLLEEGTIASCGEDPTLVGQGVIARHFIILSGSKVESSAVLEYCFIGQGVRVGKQFSAEHSAFFANCEAFHGEAVSVFAGPYSVTHHKSTLLIAGYFSFFNAGSGTNQSNHLYRLGPLHQGILERGVKTSSYSYLIWPSRIGAFSTVIGRHYSNLDSSELPFSVIKEKEGKSVLTPAITLLQIGTRRDSEKWILRDRRKDPEKLDCISFPLLNPLTVGKISKGLEVLNSLKERTSSEQELIPYNGVHVRRSKLKDCAQYYDMGISIFLGNCLQARLDRLSPGATIEDLREALHPKSGEGESQWLDAAGLLAPASSVEQLIGDLTGGRIGSLEELSESFRKIHEEYREAEWAWCLKLLESRLGTPLPDITLSQLIEVIRRWKENAVQLDSMLLEDAEKEFDESSRIGFGIDGGAAERERDFLAVRGKLKENAFVHQIEEESRRIEQIADRLIAWLQALA